MGWKKPCSAPSPVTTSGVTAPCAARTQRKPGPVGESALQHLLVMSPPEALMWLGRLSHVTLSCGQASGSNTFTNDFQWTVSSS